MIQPTVINLHPNEQSQQLHYYPLAVKSNRCVGSCNTLNDLSNKVYLPNKTEDSNLTMSNMILGKKPYMQKRYYIIFGILLQLIAKMVNI